MEVRFNRMVHGFECNLEISMHERVFQRRSKLQVSPKDERHLTPLKNLRVYVFPNWTRNHEHYYLLKVT